MKVNVATNSFGIASNMNHLIRLNRCQFVFVSICHPMKNNHENRSTTGFYLLFCIYQTFKPKRILTMFFCTVSAAKPEVLKKRHVEITNFTTFILLKHPITRIFTKTLFYVRLYDIIFSVEI